MLTDLVCTIKATNTSVWTKGLESHMKQQNSWYDLKLIPFCLSVVSIFAFSSFSCLNCPIVLFYSGTSFSLSLVLLTRQKLWVFAGCSVLGKIGNEVNSLDCSTLLTKQKWKTACSPKIFIMQHFTDKSFLFACFFDRKAVKWFLLDFALFPCSLFDAALAFLCLLLYLKQ